MQLLPSDVVDINYMPRSNAQVFYCRFIMFSCCFSDVLWFLLSPMHTADLWGCERKLGIHSVFATRQKEHVLQLCVLGQNDKLVRLTRKSQYVHVVSQMNEERSTRSAQVVCFIIVTYIHTYIHSTITRCIFTSVLAMWIAADTTIQSFYPTLSLFHNTCHVTSHMTSLYNKHIHSNEYIAIHRSLYHLWFQNKIWVIYITM